MMTLRKDSAPKKAVFKKKSGVNMTDYYKSLLHLPCTYHISRWSVINVDRGNDISNIFHFDQTKQPILSFLW